MCPRASAAGPKGGAVFSVEVGMGTEGQIMCVDNAHILDVISSVSRSSKGTKIVGGQTPLGELTAHSDILVGFKGPTSKAPTSNTRGGSAKIIYAPGTRNPRVATRSRGVIEKCN